MSNSVSTFDRVAIMGVGLIGGSIALAAKQRGVAGCIMGIGRDAARLAAAQKLGVIDEFSTSPEACSTVELVVVCTPVNRIADDVAQALQNTPETVLVTDAGSVKASIVADVERQSSQSARYVPAHPLAGSHSTGFEHANADLYNGRLCVLTPTPANTASGIARVRALWEGLGMRIQVLAPDAHDRILALTSHLPHVGAAALADLVTPDQLEFAATGFRDTTRVAAGDPELWTAIVERNSAQLTAGIDALIDSLTAFREALINNQTENVRSFFQRAQRLRSQFHDADSQPHQSHE
jgi:prephenate dehydrogenase